MLLIYRHLHWRILRVLVLLSKICRMHNFKSDTAGKIVHGIVRDSSAV